MNLSEEAVSVQYVTGLISVAISGPSLGADGDPGILLPEECLSIHTST